MTFWGTWLDSFQKRNQNPFQVVEHSAEQEIDAEDHRPDSDVEGESDFLDGMVFGMTYSDSKGQVSRRTITAFDLTERGRHIYLRGICHLRNAYREFRAERIREIITADGEVLEPCAFWQEIGIVQSLIDKISEHESRPSHRLGSHQNMHARKKRPESPGLAQRRLVRHQISILAALSRSDGNMKPEEISEIIDYICVECDDAGVAFRNEDIDALRSYIRRLRPNPEKVEESLRKLFSPDGNEALDERQLRNFRNAMRAVIDADGHLHEGEMSFMLAFEEWCGENSLGHAAPSS